MTNERARARVVPRLLVLGLAFAASPFSGCASGPGDTTDDFLVTGGRPPTGGKSNDDDDGGNGPGGASSGGMGGGALGTGGYGGDWTPDPITCETLVCQAGTCEDDPDGAFCNCPSGFSGLDCADVNECADELYCGGFPCTNAFGSVSCGCDATTVASGPTSCSDLDECAFDPCDEDADCENGSSGYSCACSDGFFGTGWDCTDVDECAGDPCGEGTCIATSVGAVCQCPLGTGGPDCSLDCEFLSVPDLNLQAAIFQLTGLYPNSIRPEVDLVGVTSLDTSGRLIESLDGLECWPNLERLSAKNLQLADSGDSTPLDALQSLTHLTTLDLGCSNGLDLSVLAGHPTLQALYLNMQNCSVEPAELEGLAALGTLKRLESLDVSGTPLGSGSGLGALRALRSLTLHDVGLSETSELEPLRLLGDLSLSNNAITDASGLAALANLRVLSLTSNRLEEIDFVSSLAELGRLDVGDNELAGLPSFSQNSRLNTLGASQNEIEDLTPLLSGPVLGSTNLSSNRIESLHPLRGANARGDVYLDDNPALEEDCEETLGIEAELRAGGLRVVSTCDVPEPSE